MKIVVEEIKTTTFEEWCEDHNVGMIVRQVEKDKWVAAFDKYIKIVGPEGGDEPGGVGGSKSAAALDLAKSVENQTIIFNGQSICVPLFNSLFRIIPKELS